MHTNPKVDIYIYIYIYTFTNPSAQAKYDKRSVFKRSLTGFNSEFFFLTKAEEPSLPYYLPIAGGRIIGFIPFTRVLVLCEMQSVSSQIWTRVACPFSTTIGITLRAPANIYIYNIYIYIQIFRSVSFDLVSFINNASTFVGYLMRNLWLWKQRWYF